MVTGMSASISRDDRFGSPQDWGICMGLVQLHCGSDIKGCSSCLLAWQHQSPWYNFMWLFPSWFVLCTRPLMIEELEGSMQEGNQLQ